MKRSEIELGSLRNEATAASEMKRSEIELGSLRNEAKPASEMKQSVVEVVHGGVKVCDRGRIYSHLGFFMLI